jgi:hypothetical protein
MVDVMVDVMVDAIAMSWWKIVLFAIAAAFGAVAAQLVGF